MIEEINFHVATNIIDAVGFKDITLKWYLDSPKGGLLSTSNGKNINIKGWILTHKKESIALLVRSQNSISQHELNCPRPDVIKKILSVTPDGHSQLICGFDIMVETNRFPLDIGFKIGENQHWVRQINLEQIRKVVAGLAGYLYLANDTNKSIDQYEGRSLISEDALLAWEKYFSCLFSNKRESRVFLIAPAKEFVLPECYPHKRGSTTPVDQIFQNFPSISEKILWPLKDLKSNAHLTYSTGDTHWTDYGAFVAAKAVCNKLGIENPFQVDLPSYNLASVDGDLISKYDPGKRQFSFMADFRKANAKVTFDNYVTNHGRVYLFENNEASTGLTAILFGDSFSNNMSRWLSFVFSRLLVIHSAGAVDIELLEKENADCIIAQSNSRFLVSPPVYGVSIKDVIAAKIKLLPADKKFSLENKIDALADSNYKQWMKNLLGGINSERLM